MIQLLQFHDRVLMTFVKIYNLELEREIENVLLSFDSPLKYLQLPELD